MTGAALDINDRPFALPAVRTVVVEMPGEPRGKGRARFSRASGVAYTPAATRNFEGSLKYMAQLAMKGAPPIEGPLKVEVLAAFSIPQSWSNKKKAAAMAGLIRPTGKPDADNVLKSAGDALNQVVWRDDAQIVIATIAKRYSDRPRLWITVEPLIGEGA